MGGDSERGPSSYITDENAWALGFNGLLQSLFFSLFVSFSHPRTLQSGLSPVPRSFVDRLVAYCSPACGFTTPRCSFHSCLYFIIVFHVHDVSPLSPPVHNIVTSIVFLYSRLAPRVLFFIYVRHRLFLVSYPRIGFIHEWM